MKLYKVTFSGRRHIGNWIVVAGCKKQAVGLIVNHLNWRRQLRGIAYQTTDFYAKKIDIDSIKKPTIID